jgi:hypothetical protein
MADNRGLPALHRHLQVGERTIVEAVARPIGAPALRREEDAGGADRIAELIALADQRPG